MFLVLGLDIVVAISLFALWKKKGIEGCLPLAALYLLFFPEESKLPTGLFDITTQRLVTLMLLGFYAADRSRVSRRPLPFKLPILFIAIWWTIATANSIAFVDSLKSLLSLLIDYLAIYLVFTKCITKVETIYRVLFGAVLGLTLSSAFGAIEAYQQWSVVSLFPVEMHRFGASGGLYADDARGLRVQSTFGHPILFGSALAMGIPIVLYLIAATKERQKKLLLWVGLLLMFVCIFKASSRGPWIALFGSLSLFLFMGHKKIRSYIVFIGLLACSVLIIRPGVLETLWNDYAATVDDHSSQGESYQYRYVLYELVMQKLAADPVRMVWGYGPQSFPRLYLSGSINGRMMQFASCDSSFAALLAETGYVGLVLISSFLLYVLFRIVVSWKDSPTAAAQLYVLFFVNIMTFCFEMTNVAIFGWGQQNILLWIVIGMSALYPGLLKHKKRESLRMRAEVAEPTVIVYGRKGHEIVASSRA
jgi:hypothetical protein